MHPVWPSDGVPWVPGSQSSGSGLACPPTAGGVKTKTTHPYRRGKSSSGSVHTDRNTDGGRGKATRAREHTDDNGGGGGGGGETTLAAGLGRDEANVHARFACGVPGCGHRFPLARLLGLHLRMGHSDFDLERMRAARDGTGPTRILDGGVPMTAEIDVGGRVRSVRGCFGRHLGRHAPSLEP